METVREGGPWYYDDSDVARVYGMGYSSVINYLRAFSGWEDAPNDVR